MTLWKNEISDHPKDEVKQMKMSHLPINHSELLMEQKPKYNPLAHHSGLHCVNPRIVKNPTSTYSTSREIFSH